ncbi:hypothetical protein DITRI_Ditri01bG0170200 [Diplodiscus trichospermus]
MEKQFAAMGLNEDNRTQVFSDPELEEKAFSEPIEDLTIKDCPKLRSVSFVGKMKSLIKLKIYCCPVLTQITTDSGLPSLVELVVEASPLLIISDIIKDSKLKNLCLCNVGDQLYDQVIQLQGEYILSNLEKLGLKEMHELKVIWKEPRQIATLQNLAYLVVFKCNKLGNIFSVVLARNLPQLIHLEVEECEELEQVVVQDRISSAPPNARHKPVFFPNLEKICIKECNKLKSLFPFEVVLPRLKNLEVKGASNLREIFGHDSEANKTSDEKSKEIVLPQLKVLLLESLPKFIGFSAVAYDFVFPVLITLTVTECPSMIIGFHVKDGSDGSYVLTEIKQSKSTKEGNLYRSITMQNIGPSRTADQNIVWKRLEK